jgi:uncharacterized protein (UPF0303 family)
VAISGGFSSSELLDQEHELVLPISDVFDLLEIGEIGKTLGFIRKLPIAIEIKLENWIMYHISLPGSNPENNFWIRRKSNVVMLKKHSSLYERINAEDQSIDWFKLNKVNEVDYAIHGGSLPLITQNYKFIGTLTISGMTHVADHLFGVEILTNYLNGRRALR